MWPFRRMKLVDRLILGAITGPFIFGILIFSLIFVAGDLLFQAARLIIENGVALSIVIRLFFYRLPGVVVMTIPMSSLLSTLLGMSTLSSGSELIALRSLGIRFLRILRPIFVASLLISVIALALNESIVPFTAMAADRLMKYEILKNQASVVQEKVFLRFESKEGLRVLYVDQLDVTEGIMTGIMMHEFQNNRLIRTLTAHDGTWQNGQWWVEDGRMYDIDRDGEMRLLLRFDRQMLSLNLSPDELQLSTRHPSDMSAGELWMYIRRASEAGADMSKLWVMFHLKLAVPWACLIMAVLGAGFGALRQGRSGGSGVGFGISVVIVFAYYVVMSMCRAFGEAGNIPPLLAGWGPNIMFLLVALFFAWRVDRQ